MTNYLAWPVHISKATDELETISAGLAGTGELVCLTRRMADAIWTLGRVELNVRCISQPTKEWATGLTAMRRVMQGASHARVVLGGRVTGYKGVMPGIAEEALLSLRE